MLNPRPAIRWSVLVEEKKVSIEKVQEVYGNSFNEWLQIYGKISEIKNKMNDFKKFGSLGSLFRVETLSKDLDEFIEKYKVQEGDVSEILTPKKKKPKWELNYTRNVDNKDEFLKFTYKKVYYNIVDNKLVESKRNFDGIDPYDSAAMSFAIEMSERIEFTQKNLNLIRNFIINKDEIGTLLSFLWFI